MGIEEKPGRLYTTLLAVVYPEEWDCGGPLEAGRPSPLTVCYCIMLSFKARIF